MAVLNSAGFFRAMRHGTVWGKAADSQRTGAVNCGIHHWVRLICPIQSHIQAGDKADRCWPMKNDGFAVWLPKLSS